MSVVVCIPSLPLAAGSQEGLGPREGPRDDLMQPSQPRGPRLDAARASRLGEGLPRPPHPSDRRRGLGGLVLEALHTLPSPGHGEPRSGTAGDRLLEMDMKQKWLANPRKNTWHRLFQPANRDL